MPPAWLENPRALKLYCQCFNKFLRRTTRHRKRIFHSCLKAPQCAAPSLAEHPCSKLSSASGVCGVIEVFVASHPTCEHFGDIVASNCSTDLPPTFVMLNGRCVASPSPSTLAVPLNSENRFGLFVFGAIGGHVHCHSARHVVSSASAFGPMMQVIVGTHFEDDDDAPTTTLLVPALANTTKNERRHTRRCFLMFSSSAASISHHPPSRRVIVVVFLLFYCGCCCCCVLCRV